MENKPDIIQTVEAAGIELLRKGSALWGRCPFHQDKTPSFKVSPDRQTFHCFGCGEGGDVIAFIQKLYGLTFPDALAFLGMKSGERPMPDPAKETKRELLRQFRTWECQYRDQLTDFHRNTFLLMGGFQTMEEVEDHAGSYHLMPVVLHHLDVLLMGTDEEKYNLYCEVKGNGEIRFGGAALSRQQGAGRNNQC